MSTDLLWMLSALVDCGISDELIGERFGEIANLRSASPPIQWRSAAEDGIQRGWIVRREETLWITLEGLAAWEDVLRPSWTRYVQERWFDEPAGETKSRADQLTLELVAGSRDTLLSLLGTLSTIAPIPDSPEITTTTEARPVELGRLDVAYRWCGSLPFRGIDHAFRIVLDHASRCWRELPLI